jgi:hypothetical protein
MSDRSSTVQAGAARMAKGVAKQIKGYMVDQKWITDFPVAAAPLRAIRLRSNCS